jgi:cell division protein FtsQ
VRSALDAAARDMTTLNVDESALRAAVARYPLVRDVRASAQPPHRLEIRVVERVPVGVFGAGSEPVVVADDGVLLRGVPADGLAEIGTRVPPGGARVADRKTAAKVAVLVEAPPKLRARIARVILGRHGLQARLGSGLVIRFGDGRDLPAKWTAARRVMRDPAAAAATYIDVRIPERPVAGGLTEQQGGAPVPVALVAAPVVTSAGAPAGVPAATAAGTPAQPVTIP